MIAVLRKLLAVIAVVCLLGPTGVTLCGSGVGRHCEAASMHECCPGPRLTDCRCDESDPSDRPSETAQQSPRIKADTTPIAAVFEAAHLDVTSRRPLWLDALVPPASMGERLSLLSTLLV